MNPNIKEISNRIRSMREDLDLSLQEMAEATGRTVAEYAAQESGEEDLSFTFLYKCANVFGVDVIELLTGESPHLRGYSLVRAGEGLSIKRHAGFEYFRKDRILATSLPSPSSSRFPTSRKTRTSPFTFPIIRGRSFRLHYLGPPSVFV